MGQKKKKKTPAAKQKTSAVANKKKGLQSRNQSFNRKKIFWIPLAVVFSLGFLVYANTFNHGYVLDDDTVIRENWMVKKGTDEIRNLLTTHYRAGYWNRKGSLYRPLTMAVFAMEYEMAPDSPSFYHRFNAFMFALLCGCIFYFLYLLFDMEKWWLALLITMLFAVHPIHTEVVANIKSLDEILSMLLAVVSGIFLWKNIRGQYLFLIPSFILYFLALMAKESVITWVAIVPMLIFFFDTSRRKRNYLVTIGYLFAAGLYLLIRKAVLGDFTGIDKPAVLDNILMGISSPIDKWATAAKIMGIYLFKIIIPANLVYDQSYNAISPTTLADPLVWMSVLAHIAMLVFGIIRMRKNPLIAFGFLFYLVTMSIFSNMFITIGSSYAERFLFYPSLGLCMAAGGLLNLFLSGHRFTSIKELKKPALVISYIIIFIFAVLTLNRNTDWKDKLTLYEADLDKAENSARAQYLLGLAWITDKANQAPTPQAKAPFIHNAIPHLKKAAQIRKTYVEAHSQLGVAYYHLGELDSAMVYYNKALEFQSVDPKVYNNMAAIYMQQGQLEQSKTLYKKAISLNPNYTDAVGNLGAVYGRLGQLDSALVWFKKAIEQKPQVASYHHYVGMTYQNMGKPKLAAPYLQRAQQMTSQK